MCYSRLVQVTAMPRITKADLEAETVRLKAELKQYRDRSRSRKRKAQFEVAPMSATSRRALDIVRKHDRDGVIEEQRVTITKQAQEIMKLGEKIADLRLGNGPIGPVLAANIGVEFDFLRQLALKRTESVAQFLTAQASLVSKAHNALLYGS